MLSVPVFEDLISNIDLEKVATEIRNSDSEIGDIDYQDAKTCVWEAGKKWLGRDIATLIWDRGSIEHEIDFAGVRGVIDVSGKVRKGIDKAPFERFGGQAFSIDWKTSKNTLDTDWKNRLVDSWQWKLYSAALDAKFFMYRGISRPNFGKCDLREILIAVPDNIAYEVESQVCGVQVLRNSLLLSSIHQAGQWPMAMPRSCKMYGGVCENYDDCVNMTMPKGDLVNIELLRDHKMSYTSMERFLQCPEKYRRQVLRGEAIQTDATIFGQAVHRGLAELWAQAWEIYGTSEDSPN